MTSQTISPPLERISLPRRWLAGWGSVLLLVTSTLTSIAAMLLMTLVLASVLLISAGGLGILLLVPLVWLCGLIGHAERHRIVALTGRRVDPPPRRVQPLWRRLFLDQHSWRSTAYLALHAMWGTIVGWLTLAVLAQALLLIFVPLLGSRIPDSGISIFGLIRIDGITQLAVAWTIALVTLVVMPLVAHLLTSVDVMFARWLLGRDERKVVEHLTARVDTLTDSRREAVDSVEAERRRIERDLHDGPQQRMVSIAMTLGMAKEAIHRDPEGAAQLVDEAHRSAKEAIVEMRHVARGIVPPILADRGLEAALPALAARSAVPVQVEVRDVGRLDPTTEAIAYFVVSEALTNVAKHSGATGGSVVVTKDDERLTAVVSDDGRGGADPTRGTGLTGLRQRVTAVDGTLEVTSPDGGPTTLTATLPLRTGRSL
ncbi:sensor histidine kinase [Janibacter anophelis]|uniref:sensor histidine kinase n=1 Tax=Janibacter anophelis TaxID=319054 RepID=UPI0008345108|nr:sensor histidine kinase [Janibacter anophelis]